MVNRISLPAVYGDSIKTVQLVWAFGEDVVIIHLDKEYQGVLMKIHNVWTPYLNNQCDLISNDILILYEVIDGKEKTLITEKPLSP